MAVKPMNAKLWFRLRVPVNYLIALAIFVPLALLFSFMSIWWIADAILIGILYYVFFFVLSKRAIGMKCPHCLKHIATNTPWNCGFCPHKNYKVDEFPFVHQCEGCGAEPKAYKCHHCDRLIYLTRDESDQNYASCLSARPVPVPAPPDKASLRREDKEALIHEIEMADLTMKLKSIKGLAELSREKTPMEEIEASFQKHHAKFMGAREFARRQQAINEATFKDDPVMLGFATDSLKAWLQSRP